MTMIDVVGGIIGVVTMNPYFEVDDEDDGF